MTEISIRIPDNLYQKACEVSGKIRVPIDEIIAASLAQKLYKIMPDPYLEERAGRATGAGIANMLDQVPDVPPEAHDAL
jgi:hypothetical protein